MPSELSFSRLYYTYFAIDGDKNFLNDSEYNEKICGIIPDSLRYKCIMIMDCRITYSYCVYNSRIN